MQHSFEIRVPSKIILSGEFSCIFGHSVIACPIPLYLNLCVEARGRFEAANVHVVNNVYEDFDFDLDSMAKELDGSDASFMPYFQFKKTFYELCTFLKLNHRLSQLDISLTYDTKILVGMGLGSSASFILSLYYFFVNLGRVFGDPVPEEISQETFEFLTDLENLFHGKSSGIDLLSIMSGRIGLYEKLEGSWVVKKSLQALKRPLRLLLINSKQRKNTKESVGYLLDYIRLKPEVRDRLKEIDELSNSIFDDLFDADYSNSIQQKINHNHRILKELSLSSDGLDQICEVFTKQGLGCKMTGGGRGGFCLAIYDEAQTDKFESVRLELEEGDFECTEYSLSEMPKIEVSFQTKLTN
jgi:mevalonate kinase